MTPLSRRLPRELRRNIGKYLGIFLLMCGSIALTSGFLLAAHSIGRLIDDMHDEYTIEDGRVTTSFEATDAQIEAAEVAADGVGGVTLYKNFSIDATIQKPKGDDGTKRTLRTYAHRTEVDLASYCEGAEPQADDEVAIDRVFAKNNGLAVGDTVKLCGRAYSVCGIMTQPDSQALFLNNSDFTVNTITYGVAEVTDAGFAALEDAGGAPAYTYSFIFKDRGISVAKRTDAEKDMVEALTDADARVDDLIDADSNQGIGYARDDVDGDSMMWTTLLDIIIVIMAFVFVVLTDATIEKESAVIGTLLASGYRKREIVLHYLALPAIVGILASLLGCTLGVSVFTEPMRNLYYGSYSLPPFRVYWSWEIFAKCAVVPTAALILITLAGLLRKMGKTPLQFLRHEASGKSGTKRGLRLPERMGFVARFRLRVFLRNLGNFATLFVGIAFASLLLLFGLAILPTMTHYADNLETSLVAAHQYTLKAPLELEGTDDEREQWAALERLQSVDGALLSAAQDAEDELEDAADALTSSPTAGNMQAATDALEKVQAKKDALYTRLDDIAKALGYDRDEAIDLIDDASGIDVDNDDVHPVNTADNGATKIEQAEKYAVYQLEYNRGDGNGTETVAVFGISPDSRYWKDLKVGDGRVVFGRGLLDKFSWKEGQQVSFRDKYEDKDYSLEYAGDDSAWQRRLVLQRLCEQRGARPRRTLLRRRYHTRRYACRGRPVHRYDEQPDRDDDRSLRLHLPAVHVLADKGCDRPQCAPHQLHEGLRLPRRRDLAPLHSLHHAVRHSGALAVSARHHRLAHRDLPRDAAGLQRQHRDLRAVVVNSGVRGHRILDLPGRCAHSHALHQARQPLRGVEGPGIKRGKHS